MPQQERDPFAWVGQTVDGRYRVDSVVGEGGFGVVYRAFHVGFQEPVAIKALKIPGKMSDAARAQFEKSFLDEGRLLHKLSKANAGIAQALDVGAAVSPNGSWTPYLVIEWLDGRPLDEELSERRRTGRGTFSLEEAVALLSPAFEALAEAHAHGVAHRDVKPANLFVTRIGQRETLKVLDFGIAKVLSQTTTLTRALEETGGSIKAFTPQYGAPEQFDPSHGATGPWTDVFAAALVLVELLTGRPALEGHDTIQLFVSASNPNLRPTACRRGASVPAAVEAVLEQALAVSPRQRFHSAGEFLTALRQALLGGAATMRTPNSAVFAASSKPSFLHRDEETLLVAPVPHQPAGAPSTTGPQIATLDRSPPRSTPRPRTGVLLAVFGGLTLLVAVAGSSSALVWWRYGGASRLASAPGDTQAPSASTSAPQPPAIPTSLMISVPPGTFDQGSINGSAAERPTRSVTISRTFQIDATEVTAEQYQQCVDAHACTPSASHNAANARCNALSAGKSRHPINCVDRQQADTYCRFVGKRLPTEAEWEYAARGSSSRRYPWGNAVPQCDYGAIDHGTEGDCRRPEGTAEVGSFPKGTSGFNVQDLAGNVREWVEDGFEPRAYGVGSATDPHAPPKAGQQGIVRGGAHDSRIEDLAAWRRVALDTATAEPSTGFRCARSLP